MAAAGAGHALEAQSSSATISQLEERQARSDAEKKRLLGALDEATGQLEELAGAKEAAETLCGQVGAGLVLVRQASQQCHSRASHC